MKSLRSSTISSARRSRSSPTEKKSSTTIKEAGGEGSNESTSERSSNLRRSTREQQGSGSTSPTAASGSAAASNAAGSGGSATKSSARRRSRGLPLRRTRNKDESAAAAAETAGSGNNTSTDNHDNSEEDHHGNDSSSAAKSNHSAVPNEGSDDQQQHSKNANHKENREAAAADASAEYAHGNEEEAVKQDNGKTTTSKATAQEHIVSPKASKSTRKSHHKKTSSVSSTASVVNSNNNKDTDRVPLTAVGENGEVINVQLVIGGELYRSGSRRRPPYISGGDGTSNGTSIPPPKDKTFLGNDGNLFYCFVCSGFGDVVCCDGCPHVYHSDCIKVGSASRKSLDNDDDPWYCPECINDKKPSATAADAHNDKSSNRHGNEATNNNNNTSTNTNESSSSSSRRVIKHRCCECQESRSGIPLKTCESCGSYLHYPSCKTESSSPATATSAPVLCSSCRAEVALNQEDEEFKREKKKRKLMDSQQHHSQGSHKKQQQHQENNHDYPNDEMNDGGGTLHEEDSVDLRSGSSRRRTRSMDGDIIDTSSLEVPNEDIEHLGLHGAGDGDGEGGNSTKRQHRSGDHSGSTSPVVPSKTEKPKKKSKRDREREKQKAARAKEKERLKAEKEKQLTGQDKTPEENEDEEMKGASSIHDIGTVGAGESGSGSVGGDRSPSGGSVTEEYKPKPIPAVVHATPAFYFFLAENRSKIERVLSRKHRYFNRLPKGMERNELVAREGALWWVKLRPIDHRRYMTMSMRDYEQKIIEWKEEKSIHDMLMARDNEIEEENGMDDADINNKKKKTIAPPDDDELTYELHERLYLGTSVGSKPYKPEADQSHNRVLLDLLRDMRFHPLPMFSVTRTETEASTATDGSSGGGPSKVTIPHFDVHGPISTSVGDECLGCSRGWAHFCPVLKRRLPAVEHRAKLQPPLSSLIATRVGLGLRPHLERVEHNSDKTSAIEDDNDPNAENNNSSDKDFPLFTWRENDEAAQLQKLQFVPCGTLTDPSSRADDIVQFIEEAVAMKIPEPPRPTVPGEKKSSSKKLNLSRGALSLPTRKKRPFDSTLPESNEGSSQSYVNKCGRCRTIITTDTGCVQCRRAQLVINMSKRQPSTGTGSSDHRPQKSDSNKGGGGPTSGAGIGLMKVQTSMLGRVMMKDSNGETQSEGDQAVAAGILKERWNPCVILPASRVLAPSPSRRPRADGDQDGSDSSDSGDESEDGSDDADVSSAGLGSNDGTPGDRKASNNNNNTEGTSSRETELRPRAAARAAAGSHASGIYDTNETFDRQLIAKKCKEEASELHKKALSVACAGILLALRRRDPLLLFANPVTAEGYEKVVKNPIDFGMIRANVLAGSYQTLGAFVSDVRRLCENACLFNLPGSIYWKTAKELYDVLSVMQKRASQWMHAIRNAHAYAWRNAPRQKKDLTDDTVDDDGSIDLSPDDPFETLRATWPEAVDMLENSDWLRNQLAADFMRTKENETAYYGSLAVRRVAAAAEVGLAPYTDTGGVHSIVVKRSHTEDNDLRRMVNERASKIVDPVELKDISSWREEAIVRLMRRVQSRRLERRIGSDAGCARCDGIGLYQDMKVAMTAERFRNKKKGDTEDTPRVAESRLSLTTGLASANTRDRIEKRRSQSSEEAYDTIKDACVSLRGSRIHGWGLFADQAFKKGDLVAEYVGEYVSSPQADLREKIYQENRIQDYQFRLDDSLVIDATVNGGHGRYINHNCNPNCMTKIIPGKPPNEYFKRVLILAARDIQPREELTYDYQFPLELDLDARIPCNCESEMCRGFMNWDLPEKGSNSHAMRTQKRGANMRDRIRRLGRPLKK